MHTYTSYTFNLSLMLVTVKSIGLTLVKIEKGRIGGVTTQYHHKQMSIACTTLVYAANIIPVTLQQHSIIF